MDIRQSVSARVGGGLLLGCGCRGERADYLGGLGIEFGWVGRGGAQVGEAASECFEGQSRLRERGGECGGRGRRAPPWSVRSKGWCLPSKGWSLWRAEGANERGRG
jgi:hypothetical protein